MKKHQEEHSSEQEVKVVYEKPAIEIIEIEMEGSILAGSGINPLDPQPW